MKRVPAQIGAHGVDAFRFEGLAKRLLGDDIFCYLNSITFLLLLLFLAVLLHFSMATILQHEREPWSVREACLCAFLVSMLPGITSFQCLSIFPWSFCFGLTFVTLNPGETHAKFPKGFDIQLEKAGSARGNTAPCNSGMVTYVCLVPLSGSLEGQPMCSRLPSNFFAQ